MKPRFVSRFLSCITLLTLVTPGAISQTLVPFDSDSSIFVLTGAFEQEHSILGVKGLYDARIVTSTDSTFRLEMTVRGPNGLQQTGRELTVPELAEIRSKVDQARGVEKESMDSTGVEWTPGSRMFVQTMSGLGLSWYGLTIPSVIGSASESAVLGTYLLTAGACYFISDSYAQTHTIRTEGGIAFQYFATRGIVHGYAFTALVMGNELDHRLAVPVATLASLIEGFSAMNAASSDDWGEGRWAAMAEFGDAGLFLGFTTGYLLGTGDPELFTDVGDNPRRYAASFLLVGGAGLLAGSMIPGSVDYAPGDAVLQGVIGYLGAAAGYTIVDLGDSPSRRSRILGTSLGYLAGHSLGVFAADRRNLSEGSGNSARLLTSGGIIVGLGLTRIVASDGAPGSTYMAAATLGGIAGLAYSLSREHDLGSSRSRSGIDLQIHPEALFNPVERVRGSALANLRPLVSLRIGL